MAFLGGAVALAFLGFLLFFELSRESMLFAYVISAIIILVLVAMLVSLRGAIRGMVGALAGRVRPEAGSLKIPRGEKPKKLGLSKAAGLPRRVSNPMLKDIMERIKEGGAEKPKGGQAPRGKKQSRPSGLLGKLGSIVEKLKIRGARKPEAGTGEMEEIKEKLAEMDELEERVEWAEDEKIAEALEGETEGKKPSRKKKAARKHPEEKKPRGGTKTQGLPEAPAEEKMEPTKEGIPREEAGYCQICGSREGLQEHYIVLLEKGGGKGEENIIVLCGRHKKQAEEGIYSENLLKRLKGI